MADSRVRVEGLDLVQSNLRRIISAFPREQPKIHEKVGQPVLMRARQRARTRTGQMRGSLRLDAKRDRVEIVAGEGVPYTGYQHFGTRYITANRFLTDPLNELETKMVRDYQRLTGRFIEKEWRSNS